MTTRLAAVQRAALLAIAGPSVTCVMRSSARARSARRIRRRLRARCRRRTNRSACASCASRRRLLPRSAQPLRSASHVAWFVAAVADCARQVASEASRAAVAMGCRLQPHAAPRCATRVVPRRRCDVSCLLQPSRDVAPGCSVWRSVATGCTVLRFVATPYSAVPQVASVALPSTTISVLRHRDGRNRGQACRPQLQRHAARRRCNCVATARVAPAGRVATARVARACCNRAR